MSEIRFIISITYHMQGTHILSFFDVFMDNFKIEGGGLKMIICNLILRIYTKE